MLLVAKNKLTDKFKTLLLCIHTRNISSLTPRTYPFGHGPHKRFIISFNITVYFFKRFFPGSKQFGHAKRIFDLVSKPKFPPQPPSSSSFMSTHNHQLQVPAVSNPDNPPTPTFPIFRKADFSAQTSINIAKSHRKIQEQEQPLISQQLVDEELTIELENQPQVRSHQYASEYRKAILDHTNYIITENCRRYNLGYIGTYFSLSWIPRRDVVFFKYNITLIFCDYLFSKNPLLAQYYKPEFYIFKKKIGYVNYESARILDYNNLPYESVSNKQYLEAQNNVLAFFDTWKTRRLILLNMYKTLTPLKIYETWRCCNLMILLLGMPLKDIELLQTNNNYLKLSDIEQGIIDNWQFQAQLIVLQVHHIGSKEENVHIDKTFADFYEKCLEKKVFSKIISENDKKTNEKYFDNILTSLVKFLPVLKTFMKAYYYTFFVQYCNACVGCKNQHERFWSYRFIQINYNVLESYDLNQLVKGLHEMRHSSYQESMPNTHLISRKKAIYLYKFIVFIKVYDKMKNEYGCEFNTDGFLKDQQYNDFLNLLYYRENKAYFHKYFSKSASFEKYFEQELKMFPLPKVILFKPNKISKKNVT